jgi:hypothetical protein
MAALLAHRHQSSLLWVAFSLPLLKLPLLAATLAPRLLLFWTEHVPSSHIQYVRFVCYYINYENYGNYIPYTIYCNAVCLLNLNEDERTKSRNWIPVGWIPVYDESRDKRPGQGFDSTSDRKFRLYHQCWIEFLDKWAERTKDTILLPWADGVNRLTRLFIGGVLGDQQEGDKYTGEPCVCHRCFAPRKRYLETADFEAKTMRKDRQRVELAAPGGYLKLEGRHNSTRVVKWDPDGRNVRLGPGLITIISIQYIMYIMSIFVDKTGVLYYESQRIKAGAHLFFNVFWLIPNFCINQMYMRDPMHQIDSGVIISFLKAVLRKFRECRVPTRDSWGCSKEAYQETA